MTQNLRWYPFAAIGSFVAQDLATVLVAPMLADGRRSTYEGEIVGLDEDTRANDEALDAQTRRWVEVGKLADGFRSVLRSWLTEAQLIEIQIRNNREATGSEVCHTHDFCDSNMAMFDAFKIALGREMVLGEGADADRDSELFNDAWGLAKSEGFATWTASAEDLASLERIAQNAEVGVALTADAATLRLLVDRFKSTPAPAPFDPSSDGDRPK